MATRPKIRTHLTWIDLLVVDAILAVALTIAALFATSSQDHHGLRALVVLTCVAAGTSVAWRRRAPLITTLIAITALAVFTLFESANSNAQMFQAMALDFYMLGRRANGRHNPAVVAMCLIYGFAALTTGALRAGGQSVADIIEACVIFVGLPFAAGHILTRRRTLIRQLAETAASLEREQQASAMRAAEEERNRMARELHDAIAHSLSVMVIQASASRRMLTHDRQAAQDALHVVQHSGREALEELRQIMGVVHRDDELAGTRQGLSQLDGLVARARAAGLDVELRTEGPLVMLSPALDLVAYRIVQEALTNAIRHAGPARAVVRMGYDTSAIELDISDTGRGLANATGEVSSSGYGLIGMRERVSLFGGELWTGPGREGGFLVHARIPLPAETS